MHQGIIDPTEAKTFAKEPKLAKLLWEQKSTPFAVSLRKPNGFSRMSVTASWLCLGALLRDTCKWVLFPGIDVYHYWLT